MSASAQFGDCVAHLFTYVCTLVDARKGSIVLQILAYCYRSLLDGLNVLVSVSASIDWLLLPGIDYSWSFGSNFIVAMA